MTTMSINFTYHGWLILLFTISTSALESNKRTTSNDFSSTVGLCSKMNSVAINLYLHQKNTTVGGTCVQSDKQEFKYVWQDGRTC